MMKRFVNGIMEDPIWQKRVPQKVPDWLQTATVSFPSGRTAEELVANDAAHLVWAVNLGVIDFNPWPCRRADLDHPGRAARGPRPRAGRAVGRRAARRAGRPRRAGRARAARLSEDVGLQGHPRAACGSRPTGSSWRCGARPWRWRARSPGARPSWRPPSGGRRSATACSWTTTRTRATAPSRPGTACARRRTRACRARWSGRRWRTSNPATCGWTRCRRGWPRSAIRRRRSTTCPGRWTRCWTSRGATRRAGSATRRGRRTSRRRRVEPKRVQPSRDADRPVRRGRAGDPQPGGPPPGFSSQSQRGFGSKPRTGQGHESEFERGAVRVRAFPCAVCGLQLTFESHTCVRCGSAQGFRWPDRRLLAPVAVALRQRGARRLQLAAGARR